jgi:hypothetical protein
MTDGQEHTDMQFQWKPLQVSDLDCLNKIADQIHATLPERPEVFEEKVRLFPAGCRKLVSATHLVGYGISHPWLLYSIPPLDAFLKALPESPQCLYIHDVVVLPVARGHNAAGQYVRYVKELAGDLNISSLALVSVYGTDVLWRRFGFHIVRTPDLDLRLASYGSSAKYMICEDI